MQEKILFIESTLLDSIAFQELIEGHHLPYTYTTVSSIFEAKKALEYHTFDIIILDIYPDLTTVFDFVHTIFNAQIILLNPDGNQQNAVQSIKVGPGYSKLQGPQQCHFSALLTGLEHALAPRQMPRPPFEQQALIVRAKQEWELTIDILPQLVCLLDTAGHIRRINRTVEHWHVGDVVSARGLHVHTLLHPLCSEPACYLTTFLQQAWAKVRQGESATYETLDVWLKRALRLEIRSAEAAPQVARQQTESFLVCIMEDISERWGAQQALCKSATSHVQSARHSITLDMYDRRQDKAATGEAAVQLEERDLPCFLDDSAQFYGMLGKSTPMQEVYRLIRNVGKLDTTVLIEGETGTGKELVAKAIHAFSLRHDKPLIAVNCAGLSESILGSQLFGHKRGSFTGAIADQAGFLEAANGGTLFLDEIGDMPIAVQTMLLRALQEREIVRLGESKPRPIDVRLLAATQHDLQEEVTAGRFRRDLLYRICVVPIQLPPLRERQEDIPLLASTFLGQFHEKMHKPVRSITAAAMQRLQAYPWPGNVRELKAVIEFAVIHCQSAQIQIEDLPRALVQVPVSAHSRGGETLDEKQLLMAVLEQAGGNRRQAARLLGIGKSTLYRRLASLEIPAKQPGLHPGMHAPAGLQESFR